jgi:hypothetical protein
MRHLALPLLILVSMTSSWATPSGVSPSAPPPAAGTKVKLMKTYRDAFSTPGNATEEAERMRELVEKLNRMSLRPQPVVTQPAEPDQPIQPEKLQLASPVEEADSPVLTARTLKELRSKTPQSVADPIKLADALYHSGYKAEALVFYQSSLPNAKRAQDRCWLMYQLGICLMETDPAGSRRWFQRLAEEYPGTQWSTLAETQGDLLDWKSQNQPRQFLLDLRRDLAEKDERTEADDRATPRTDGQDAKTGSGPQARSNPASQAAEGLSAPAAPAQESQASPK